MNDLFDHAASGAGKTEGMERAAMKGQELLSVARGVAIYLAAGHPHGECDADAVGEELAARGYSSSLGPVAGSIFKGKLWRFTGRRINSKRVSNHAREIKVWRLGSF